MGWINDFHRTLSVLKKQKLPYTGLNNLFPACLQTAIPLRQLSLAVTIILASINQIQLTLESKCGEILYEMQWISRWIFLRNAVKCGEIFLNRIYRNHRIYKILPKNLDPGNYWNIHSFKCCKFVYPQYFTL